MISLVPETGLEPARSMSQTLSTSDDYQFQHSGKGVSWSGLFVRSIILGAE